MNCGGAREGLISHLAVLMGRANRPCFAWLIVCWLYYCALSRCPLAVVSARPRRRQGPVINHVVATDSLSAATLIPVTQRNEGKERDERLKKGTKAKERERRGSPEVRGDTVNLWLHRHRRLRLRVPLSRSTPSNERHSLLYAAFFKAQRKRAFLLLKPYLLPAHSHRTIYLLDTSLSARVEEEEEEEEETEEGDACEVFISTGISLPPLIPSLGSPLLFIFCSQ